MPTSWLEFFSGGVPSLEYFLLQIKDLKRIAGQSKVEGGIDTAAELCLIGLAAYFEAFCKNEFAAVINICPEVLIQFSEKRECRLSARNVVQVIPALQNRLGFVIAEEYDFGSAKAINGIFQDLLSITPFSRKEAERYANFLNDRNLLVHHGGIYTAKYKGQYYKKRKIGGEIYFDSLVVGKKDVYYWAQFLTDLANKIGRAVSGSLSSNVAMNKIICGEEGEAAIRFLGPEAS